METAIARPTTPAWTKERKRVVASSFLGSAIEYYDLMLYATAATVVFGPVFFQGMDPAAQIIASYATFAVAYIARPLGGIIFGHFGDRVGRKKMLILSMTVMGIASTLIGLIPAIPTWGAIILVTMRTIQGVAIGGEWAGAALMSLEHSDGTKRGLAASFTNAGAPAGAFLGSQALALFAILPRDEFLSWGWRVPFLLSGLLLIIGLYIRAKISESPVFLEAARRAEGSEQPEKHVPLVAVLRRPKNVLVVGMSIMASFAIQATYSSYGINHAAKTGSTTSQALQAFSVSQFFAVFGILVAGSLSDRIGRRPVMMAGLVGSLVLAFPIFGLIGSGNFALVVLGYVIALSVLQSLTWGPMAAFAAEHFGTRSRYTGASLGNQLASLLGAGFTPVIAASLVAASGGNADPVKWYLIALCAVSLAVILFVARESRHADINQDHIE